jgi:hypothetical protein
MTHNSMPPAAGPDRKKNSTLLRVLPVPQRGTWGTHLLVGDLTLPPGTRVPTINSLDPEKKPRAAARLARLFARSSLTGLAHFSQSCPGSRQSRLAVLQLRQYNVSCGPAKRYHLVVSVRGLPGAKSPSPMDSFRFRDQGNGPCLGKPIPSRAEKDSS